jgi:hypothetical protein
MVYIFRQYMVYTKTSHKTYRFIQNVMCVWGGGAFVYDYTGCHN